MAMDFKSSRLRTAASVVALAWAVGAPAVSWAQDAQKANSKATEAAAVDEVIVTGTNIRGQAVIGKVTTLTRENIEQQGFRDLGEAIRALPGSFGGGINPEAALSAGSADYATTNRSFASSPNLLGLGSGATLTLLNGHRLPAAGEGVSVNLALIPLAAVERVEVLSDGASAIYGADAVAGVVNIITRRAVDGIETRVGYGSADGGLGTYTASVVAGKSIGAFSGVIGVEYSKQNSLDASKREASRLSPTPSTVVGESERASAFASVQYAISDNIKIHADGVYMNSVGQTYWSDPIDLTQRQIKNHQYAVSGGLTAIAGGWTIDLSGTKNANAANAPVIFYLQSDGSFDGISKSQNSNDLWSVEALASGPLFTLPAGLVSGAFGASYREESLSSLSNPSSGSNRDVKSFFGELTVPLIGDSANVPFVKALKLSIAGRHDDYTDFGGVSVPKIGLAWDITSQLSAHGTYSKSFRAPSPYERSVNYYVNGVILRDTPGNVQAIYLSGAGKALTPERSVNYNVGLTYAPVWLDGLKLSLDGYRITYTNRITRPDPNYAFQADIRNAPAQLIVRNPSAQQIADLIKGASYAGGPFPLSQAVVLVDVRTTNIADTLIEGVQGSVNYQTTVGRGVLNLSFDANYIRKFTYQLAADTPTVERAGTIFSPPKWRSRAGARWSGDGWSGGIYWNYVDSYVDDRVTNAPVPVGAYNTFDAGLSYDFSARSGVGKGVRLTLSATNVFDKGPPLVASTDFTSMSRWDAANASIVGRFAKIEIVKQW